MFGLPGVTFFIIFILWPLEYVVALILALNKRLWEEEAS